MSKERNAIHHRLKRAILASGVSRRAVAEASGVEEATLSRFMAGKRDIKLATLDALACVLGLRLVQSKKKPRIPHRPPGRPRKAR